MKITIMKKTVKTMKETKITSKEQPDGKYIMRSLGMSFISNDSEEKKGTRIVEGLAAVYNKVAEIGCWFREQIAPGAFDHADLSDVAFYLNHDINKIPMARCRASRDKNSLSVWADGEGLKMKTELDVENNTDSRALCSALDRGDVDQMSFCFIVGEERWTDLDSVMPLRTITSIKKVVEISAVTMPAYEDTSIGFARAQRSLESDRAALEKAKTDEEKRVTDEVCNINMMKQKIAMMN